MKHKLKTTIASLVLSFAAPVWAGSTGTAQPLVSVTDAVSTEVTAGYATDYIWRGVKRGENLVEGGLKFGLSLDEKTSISLGAYGAGADDFDQKEVDFSAGIAHDFGALTASAEYTYFDYNELLGADTQELALGLKYTLPYEIETSLKYFVAVEGSNGGYSELALSKTFTLSDSQSVVGTATQGFLVDEGEFAHTTLDLSYNYRFTAGITASPFVSYSFGQEGVGDKDAGFVAGLKGSIKF